MRWRTILLLLGATISAGLFTQSSPALSRVTQSASATCQVALPPDGRCPKLQWAPLAELLPLQRPGLQRAYFAMGCFWGSEAMLAGCPGVEFTTVGFTGGTAPDPTYQTIGDHVETVEVLYDPKQLSYPALLEYFWSHHNAQAKPLFRQYASAVFTTNPQETEVAKSLRDQKRSAQGEPLLTAVLPLQTFYPADLNHQKHYLQQDPDLVARLPREGSSRWSTRLAVKLNALLGSGGSRKELHSALRELGVQDDTCLALFQRASWPLEKL